MSQGTATKCYKKKIFVAMFETKKKIKRKHWNTNPELVVDQTKHQILTIFVANFAETQPNSIRISEITQKTVQNAENEKKTAKN